MDVKLSNEGLALLKESTVCMNELSDRVQFSDEDAVQLSDLLDKFREAST